MSIEHQTAISIVGLEPAIQRAPRSRIWLVMIGAIMGAGMQLGVTAAVHHVHAEHHQLAMKQHRMHVLAQHHGRGCTFVRK